MCVYRYSCVYMYMCVCQCVCILSHSFCPFPCLTLSPFSLPPPPFLLSPSLSYPLEVLHDPTPLSTEQTRTALPDSVISRW